MHTKPPFSDTVHRGPQHPKKLEILNSYATMNTNNVDLPRILCLHGGGTSALIFNFQARKLVKALRPYFRLVFVDAPFECEAGAGVLPVFEGAGPYYTFLAPTEDDEEIVRSTLHRKLNEEDGAPIVGLVGFSQGGKIAAGLLHEQQQTGAVAPHLKFGVIFNGSYPPLRQPSNPSTILPSLSESVSRREWNDEHEGCIRLPSVHVHGTSDSAIDNHRLLARCFDPSMATVMEFNNGHHMPTSDDDTQEVVEEILRIYRNEP